MAGASLADSIVNQGTVTVSGAGGTLGIVGNGSFVNQGTLAVSGGALAQIATAGFQNTGVITVSNATLALGGTYATSSLANLGSVTLSNGQIELLGSARNSGTLTLGSGSSITGSLGALSLGGTLAGGTVIDNGGGMSFAAGTGTLSGVTYQGAINLGSTASGVTLAAGAQIAGANGAPGHRGHQRQTRPLSACQGNETLNSANITLGASGQAASIGTSDAWLASSATTATLGAGVTIVQGGANAALNANAFSPIAGFGLSDTLVNQGVIQANVGGGTV